MTPLDTLCLTAAAAGKVVLWTGRALSLTTVDYERRRGAIEAAVARAKEARR